MSFEEPTKLGGNGGAKGDQAPLVQVGGIWNREGKLSGQLHFTIDEKEVKVNFKILKNNFQKTFKQPTYHIVIDSGKYGNIANPVKATS